MTERANLSEFTIRPGVPGVRRSQLIDPRPGLVEAAIEDDFHNFRVALHHDGAVVSKIVAVAPDRSPWSTCPAAAEHLAQRLAGASLDALPLADSSKAHCTHMHELALLAASHAHDRAPVLYSSFVGDPVDGLQDGEVWINGAPVLAMTMDGSRIVSDGPLQGYELRQYARWEAEVPVELRSALKVLRRMVQVSGGRRFDYAKAPVAERITGSKGACYTFQPERSPGALLTMDTRDFSAGPPPLAALIARVMDRPERG